MGAYRGGRRGEGLSRLTGRRGDRVGLCMGLRIGGLVDGGISISEVTRWSLIIRSRSSRLSFPVPPAVGGKLFRGHSQVTSMQIYPSIVFSLDNNINNII